jgi:hypothetical protein
MAGPLIIGAAIGVGVLVYVLSLRARGVIHAKGSDVGLLALVVQVTDLNLGGDV